MELGPGSRPRRKVERGPLALIPSASLFWLLVLILGAVTLSGCTSWPQQSGEVVASAIQTARETQANQIEFNLTYPKDRYNIYRAERDVIEYHNMCSMETALAQIRASLKATSPDAGRTPPAAQGSQTQG